MTFEALETSEQGGAPVQIVTFVIGALTRRYTSAESDVVIGGNTYTSTAIVIPEFEATAESARNSIELDVPRDNPIAEFFRVSPPSTVIAVTIARFHRTDADLGVVIEWIGRVMGSNPSGARASLQCQPISTSALRSGLNDLYDSNCNYVFGGPDCGVDRASFGVTTTVTTVNGLFIAASGLDPARSWAGGDVQWTDDEGLPQIRYIDAFDGDTEVIVTIPFLGLEVGDTVTFRPACRQTTADCDSYGNQPNYGGEPLIPTQNPFDGNPVY